MNKRAAHYIVYLALLTFSFIPLVAGFGFALAYSFGLTGVLNTGFTFSNWQKLFAETNIIASFFYSAAIAASSLTIAVFLAIMIALKHQHAFSKGVLSYLVYIPLAFPGIVAAFFFYQFFTKAGFLSRIFYQLNLIDNIQDFPDLVNDTYGIGMIVTFVFLAFPFFLLLFINIIKAERIPEFRQLAATLGAGMRQTLWRVSVPILLRSALPNIILYFIFIFGTFEIPLLLGRSNPETISVLAIRKLQRFNLLDLPQGYSVAVIYSLFVFAILYLLFKNKKIANDA